MTDAITALETDQQITGPNRAALGQELRSLLGGQPPEERVLTEFESPRTVPLPVGRTIPLFRQSEDLIVEILRTASGDAIPVEVLAHAFTTEVHRRQVPKFDRKFMELMIITPPYRLRWLEARDLFIADGNTSATVEQICEIVGISPRTFHRHFPVEAGDADHAPGPHPLGRHRPLRRLRRSSRSRGPPGSWYADAVHRYQHCLHTTTVNRAATVPLHARSAEISLSGQTWHFSFTHLDDVRT
ncbi:TetR/AcrR family transcriptional regulator [Nocardia rhamnosiphila]|uniref:HTH araC/xylS-type domain-containing protein n=1 Tax=Nocardia rhamnosiphila TaxID=426716 RepID=A0ABV2WRG6_9NOCA